MMADSNHSVAPATIGPFRIVRVLGQGAMGVVYLGERMEQFSQRVAIKMLHPQISLLFGEQSLKQEEAVLTSLDHPSIVRLLDTGEQAGLGYIVMEYVAGRPLDAYCREGGLTREARVRLLLEAARALDYAHRRLVIHADLKPENILVTSDGQLKLLDFGVAVLIDSAGGTGGDRARFFTPAFASPEQMGGERATLATDIYSLGMIGKLLLAEFAGRELTAVVEMATRVEPGRRYGSAREFADDLQAVLEHRPVAARRGRRLYRWERWVRRHWVAAAIVGMVALVLMSNVAGVLVQTVRAARERTLAQAQLEEVVKLTGTLAGELYDSAKPLSHANQARETLLRGATQTLDKLSETVAEDPGLSLEMARQYEVLAQLERNESASPRNRLSAQHDLEKAEGLLAGPAAHSAVAAAELKRAAALSDALSK